MHIAHEHPIDVNSSPSSRSSGEHTYLHSHRRRGSKAGSSSSHLLARLISQEEEVREVKATLVVTSERLEAESSRANAAERRALDYFHRLRIATENRERAEQESARLREELKLYQLQLENAQKEIFRAQNIIDQVASQRNEAEAEAAKARTKARKLQEEKLVMLAREEGRKMGYREGLSMGRRIGYDEGRGGWLTGPPDRLPHYPLFPEINDGDEAAHELGEATTDEEHIDPRPYPQLRPSGSMRQQPYVTDRVTRSSLLTLITECAPNRRPLYVRLILPWLLHSLSASTRLLLSITPPLHLVTPMGQKPSTRYRSALARLYLPGPRSTMDGSRHSILARPKSTCHPRTNCSNIFLHHPVLLRLMSRIVKGPLN